jgi:hypothetical protein
MKTLGMGQHKQSKKVGGYKRGLKSSNSSFLNKVDTAGSVAGSKYKLGGVNPFTAGTEIGYKIGEAMQRQKGLGYNSKFGRGVRSVVHTLDKIF